MKKSSTKTTKEIENIIFYKSDLLLNCPYCKEIPYLSLNKNNIKKINIKCDKCNKNISLNLNDYMSKLSTNTHLNTLKCSEHNNFYDKFCILCNMQFCSKCKLAENHSSHKTKNIKKITKIEKIQNAKKIIEKNKNFLKRYISEYMKINKFKYVINKLLIPYINNMKYFFHFCDCVISNYDIEYPNYYQQWNLNELLYYLNEEVLIDLKSNKPETIFDYNTNNFMNIKNLEKNILSVKDTLNFDKDKIEDVLLIDDELMLISFQNNLFDVKLYNYKTKNIISTIKASFSKTYFSESEFYFTSKELKLINKDIFAFIINCHFRSVFKIFSISSNNSSPEKLFNCGINSFKKIDENSFGIALDEYIEIYNYNCNEKNIDIEVISRIKIPKIEDFMLTSDKAFIVVLTQDKIIIYNKKYLSIFKEIEIKKEHKFKNINDFSGKKLILGGKIIAIFDMDKFEYNVIYDEKIIEESIGGLTGVSNYLNYSDFFLNYFNKLICKRLFIRTFLSHYGDDDYSDTTNKLCVFDFNHKKNSVNLFHLSEDFNIKKININNKGELIVICENKILIADY